MFKEFIMQNQNQINSTKTNLKGELTYDDKVVQKIIGLALANVKGLLTVNGGFFSNLADKIVNSDDVTSGIDVEVGKQQVAVDLEIVAEYDIDISKLYDQIKTKIVEQVKKMTDLNVIEVNVKVVDIKTKAEYEKDVVSLQDRVENVTDKTKKAVNNQKENDESTARVK